MVRAGAGQAGRQGRTEEGKAGIKWLLGEVVVRKGNKVVGTGRGSKEVCGLKGG